MLHTKEIGDCLAVCQISCTAIVAAMDRDTEGRTVPSSRNRMARSKKLSGFILEVKILLLTPGGTACYLLEGRHGKSVTASVHTLSLGGRKIAAELATDRSVECIKPVHR